MSKVKEMLKELGKIKANQEMVVLATSKVHKAVKAIFDDLPFVNVIAVEGYTPYFNDGDECRWSINTQVDWLGESYRAPICDDNEDFDKYENLLSEQRPVDYKSMKSHKNHDVLNEANELLLRFNNEFHIMDDGSNGTWWMYIRTPEGFRVEVGNFEHD